MTADVDMYKPHYRKHFDISLPPPFIAGVGRDNELIIKFFTTFYGEPASHRSRPWIIRYHNESLGQILVSKHAVPQFKNNTNKFSFDDVLIDTDYMMTPRGTQRFSFRWRDRRIGSGNYKHYDR
eukprot:487725_1